MARISTCMLVLLATIVLICHVEATSVVTAPAVLQKFPKFVLLASENFTTAPNVWQFHGGWPQGNDIYEATSSKGDVFAPKTVSGTGIHAFTSISTTDKTAAVTKFRTDLGLSSTSKIITATETVGSTSVTVEWKSSGGDAKTDAFLAHEVEAHGAQFYPYVDHLHASFRAYRKLFIPELSNICKLGTANVKTFTHNKWTRCQLCVELSPATTPSTDRPYHIAMKITGLTNCKEPVGTLTEYAPTVTVTPTVTPIAAPTTPTVAPTGTPAPPLTAGTPSLPSGGTTKGTVVKTMFMEVKPSLTSTSPIYTRLSKLTHKSDQGVLSASHPHPIVA